MRRPDPTAAGPDAAVPAEASAARWMRLALGLLVATLAWDAVEAGVALWAAHRAGSVSLATFGLDSGIELLAAGALVWRLSRQWAGADAEAVERSERRVERLVGGTFIALALYVTADAAWTLWRGEHAAPSALGLALAVAALIVMPALAWAKLHAAARLDSGALRAEAKESLACAYLSAVLLLGLGANAALGWGWMDSVAALLMVPWLVKEGHEALAGEDDED